MQNVSATVSLDSHFMVQCGRRGFWLLISIRILVVAVGKYLSAGGCLGWCPLPCRAEADSPPSTTWWRSLGCGSWLVLRQHQECHSRAYAVTAAPEQEETILHTQLLCWEQCAKHCLGLLLGLVLYQSRANKFKTDLAAFMKTIFSGDLLAKEKCGKWHECFSTLWRQLWGRGGPGDVEAHLHLTLPATAPLGSLQSLWLMLREKLGPYL